MVFHSSMQHLRSSKQPQLKLVRIVFKFHWLQKIFWFKQLTNWCYNLDKNPNTEPIPVTTSFFGGRMAINFSLHWYLTQFKVNDFFFCFKATHKLLSTETQQWLSRKELPIQVFSAHIIDTSALQLTLQHTSSYIANTSAQILFKLKIMSRLI